MRFKREWATGKASCKMCKCKIEKDQPVIHALSFRDGGYIHADTIVCMEAEAVRKLKKYVKEKDDARD